ncbi:MAG TPA: hypothetical protein ENI98_09695 [Gammaproteobacteria bacterium]|nr:hypothetical protein [Gammaproteobacteria bacterium]
MDYLGQLEKILESRYRLLTVETYDTDRVVDLFTQLSRFSNKAFYMSQPNEGMHRLGAAHITIPRSKTAKEQLEHIENTRHFGIYILRDFNYALDDPKIITQLKSIATGPDAKVIIFLSEFVDLPKELKPYTMRSKHQLKHAI